MPLTQKAIEHAKVTGERYDLADGKVEGLTLRVGASGTKTWSLLYRVGRKQRRVTLGRFPTVGLEAARKAARDALARVQDGEDPALDRVRQRETPTLAEAIETYLGGLNLAKRTVQTNRQRLAKHVIPILGGRRITDVAKADVRRLHKKITDAGSPVAANRAIETLRAFYSWAADEWPDLIKENPATGFKRNAESLRTRLISPEERATLLETIAAAEAKTPKTEGHLSPTYANAFRLALVTGMRPIDLVTLRSEHIARAEVDGRKLWIAEWSAGGEGRTKKANQRRVLNTGAIEIIEAQEKRTGGKGWVFPNAAGKQSTSNQLARSFRIVREAAGLPPEVTLYASRHTYVSEAVMAGIPLAVVGADVDNAHAVQRYAHLQRAVDAGISEQVLEVLRRSK